MKSIFFLIIIAMAIISLLPIATSTQTIATGMGTHQLQSEHLAVLGTRQTVSSPTQPGLTLIRDKLHDTPLERGTVLLFGIGLIALTILWKFPGNNR